MIISPLLNTYLMHSISVYTYMIISLPPQASCKSNPGKHHTISQEIKMEEQPKSKGKEKPTTQRRNKSINSAGCITSSETTASSSSASSKHKRDSLTPSSPSRSPRPRKPRRARIPLPVTTTTVLRSRRKNASPAAAAAAAAAVMTATAPPLTTATTNS